MVYYERVIMRKVLLATLFAFVTVVAAFGQGTNTKCPEITVVGPAGLTLAGDVMVFSADIKVLDTSAAVTYEWKVTAGVIADGQGTNQIRVRTTAENAGSKVTATVSVKGLAGNCSTIASEEASVAPRLDCGLREEYGHIPWPDEKARLYNLLLQLHHNPKSVGFLYIQIEPHETVDKTKKHIAKILNFIRSSVEGFDLARLRFAIHKSNEEHSTTLYVVAEGAEFPKCDEGCTLLNGNDVSR